jgi:hypothetical protein
VCLGSRFGVESLGISREVSLVCLEGKFGVLSRGR